MQDDTHNSSGLGGTVVRYLCGQILALVCAVGANHYLQVMKNQDQRAAWRFHTAVERYLALHDEARLVRELYPRVLALQTEGVFGQERRLDWIEVLHDYRRRTQVPVLNYRIGPRSESTGKLPTYHGPYRLFSSTMHLYVEFRHEGELLQLFDDLDRRAPGIHTVSRCALRRLHETVAAALERANITIECTVLWFSITAPQEGKDLGLS